jgi:hypothetical protein
MRELISSPNTLLYKRVVLVLMILILCGSISTIKNPIDLIACFAFLFILLVLYLVMFLPLKKVEIDDSRGKLYISAGGEVFEIEKSEILDVSDTKFQRPKVITVKLNKKMKFGDTIKFVPKVGHINPFIEHPLVNELRRFSGLEQIRDS